MIRGLVLGIGVAAAVVCAPAVATAAPDREPDSGATEAARDSSPDSTPARGHRGPPSGMRTERILRANSDKRAESTLRAAVPAARAAAPSVPSVTVDVPPLPVEQGQSFEVSREAVTTAANDYVAAGGDPKDNPRFFFGDLAVRSLDALATPNPPPAQVRANLGNLTLSGYFGGVWLRDNLREAPAVTAAPPQNVSATSNLSVSAIGIRIFDTLAAGLAGIATGRTPWIATTAARASVPVLLTLYGYNRGYLQFLLENPPAGVPSRLDSLSCKGFLDCNSTAFPLEIANRYDTALASLTAPTSLPWREMAGWTSLLEGATGTGRAVWENIARAGAFSPASYGALVDLSSAYLMVSKAAVLSSMQAYANDDPDLARSSLRLQAGLWMWSGAYFGGLASDAPRGTIPTIATS